MTANRVLIIDDDIRTCHLYRRLADELGCPSRIISDPSAQAVSGLDFTPDIVLLDLQMPQTDGVRVLKDLVAHCPDAAIIIISGVDEPIIAASMKVGRSMGLSMVGSLTKPVNLDRLKEKLAKSYSPRRSILLDSPEVSMAEFSDALVNDELIVHYQPQIDLRRNRLIGAEALVRWQHPRCGLLGPDSFVPLVERNPSLIDRMTSRVLDLVLESDQRFRAHGLNLNFSVNLSAAMLDDATLADRIFHRLRAAEFDPKRLMIEITESAIPLGSIEPLSTLTRLRLGGISLSVDDFGTGFSSLMQLYRFPFSEVKIDKSFVIDAGSREEATAIVESTIALGHRIGLHVVAEGIEDRATATWLTARGCDIGQGFFYCRPAEQVQFSRWCRDRAHARDILPRSGDRIILPQPAGALQKSALRYAS